MTTEDAVYSLRFLLIKTLAEPGFDFGTTTGESSVLTVRLHMLYDAVCKVIKFNLPKVHVYIAKL